MSGQIEPPPARRRLPPAAGLAKDASADVHDADGPAAPARVSDLPPPPSTRPRSEREQHTPPQAGPDGPVRHLAAVEPTGTTGHAGGSPEGPGEEPSGAVRRQPAVQEAPATPEAAAHDAAIRRPSTPDALGRGRPRTTAAPKGRKQRSTTISIPFDVRERLKVRAGAVGVSRAQVIKDAVEALHSDLPRLVAEHQARESSPGQIPPNGLFARREEAASRAVEHKVPTGLLMTDDDLAVLDSVVSETGAESRSQLCWVVLEEHLAEG